MTVKKILRFTVFLIVSLLGAGALAWLVEREGVDIIWSHLRIFGVIPFLGFVSISLLNFLLASWRWQIIINEEGSVQEKKLSLYKSFAHRMAGYGVSYITPAALIGGEPAKIALATKDKIKVSRATSSVILDTLFDVSANIFFMFAGVVLALMHGLGQDGSFTNIIIGMIIAILSLGVFFWMLATGKKIAEPIFSFMHLNRIKVTKRLCRLITKMELQMSRFLQKKKQLVFLLAILSFTVISFRIIEVLYIAYFFDVSLNFAEAFLISALPGLALFIPVPGGVGVFEGSFAALFGVLGIATLNPVAFAFVIRARDLIFVTLGLSHLSITGRNYLDKKLFK